MTCPHSVYLILIALFAFLPLSTLFAAKFDSPWVEPPAGGVQFTIPELENVPDLHGEMDDPNLVVFIGGNEFMVLPELMQAFRSEYPSHQKIFYETLPPGILEQQLKTGSLVIGNLKITNKPDVLIGGVQRLRNLDEALHCFAAIQPHYRNRLALMVRRGNPKNIRTLEDLGRSDVKVSMPNPETEGIARKAMNAFQKAGGESLVEKIMEAKVHDGTTFITQIHHRRTPMRIMSGLSDGGPVWRTEAEFQQRIGNPIDLVEIREEHNVSSTTAAGLLKNAEHPQAARDFITFLGSEKSRAIYRKYGFQPLDGE